MDKWNRIANSYIVWLNVLVGAQNLARLVNSTFDEI